MKIRFIHTADLHLDTPFRGLFDFNKELATKLKDATFQAFKNIIDCCIEKKVDFIIISGDIFDAEERSISAQIRFVTELKRLSEKGIGAYFICGNHDYLGSWLDTLHIPEHSHRFGTSLESISFIKEGIVMADIYGISFGTRAVSENLAIQFNRKNDPAPISIAVCHGTIGPAGEHHNYAPFQLEDILDKNFDYWAMGHIHKRHIINHAFPTLLYPGNPQGRDFGESGSKGCYLVEMEPGHPPKLEFQSVEVVRFEKIQVDLTGIESIDQLPRLISDGIRAKDDFDDRLSYIVQIIFSGKTILHAQMGKPDDLDDLRIMINEGQLDQTPFTWIDRIINLTRPNINMDEIERGNDFAAEIVKHFGGYTEDPLKRTTLLQSVQEELLSAPIRRELHTLSVDEQAELFEKAKWLLLDQILNQ